MEFLRFLEGIRTPFGEVLMSILTYGGEAVLIVAAVCILYWCVNKKLAYKICFAYFASGLMVQGLKIMFRVPRPWIKDPSFTPVAYVFETATGYSFPSGHTQTATAFYLTLALNAKKKLLKALCIIMIVTVGFSRMYLGFHTPADVIAACLISIVLVLLVHFLMKNQEFNNKQSIMIMLVMILISLGLAIYSFSMLYSGIIEEKYVADCCKAASAGLAFAIGWFIERKYINFSVKAPLKIQALKCTIGLLAVAGIQAGLKPVIGDSILADSFRYGLLILWVLVLYPLIIKRFFSKNDENVVMQKKDFS